jgi:hypothetical protein
LYSERTHRRTNNRGNQVRGGTISRTSYQVTRGLKAVAENTWLVSFMDYDLGYIDPEEKSLQPLENPFEVVKV